MRLFPLLVLAIVFLAPTAAAAYAPAVYYLKDDDLGAAAPGLLNSSQPRATQPSQRVVPLALPNVPAATFATPEGLTHHPRMYGPVYVGLWLGPGAVIDGNLTATLWVKNGTRTLPLANATMPLDLNASKAPDPTQLVPPDPTDPQGTAAYELAKLLPMLTPPARLLYLGTVDALINASDPVLLSFSITPGDGGGQAAQGVAATIQYNGSLQPSFLYIPWFKPEPPRAVPSRVIEPPREYVSITPTEESIEEKNVKETGGRGIPGPDAALLLLAMALAVGFVARRRKP